MLWTRPRRPPLHAPGYTGARPGDRRVPVCEV